MEDAANQTLRISSENGIETSEKVEKKRLNIMNAENCILSGKLTLLESNQPREHKEAT